MLNVGTPELLVIMVVALLVLGPEKLPGAARQVGRAIGEIRRLGSNFQAEMRDAMQEPVRSVPPEPAAGPTVPRPRRTRPLEATPAERHDDDPTA